LSLFLVFLLAAIVRDGPPDLIVARLGDVSITATELGEFVLQEKSGSEDLQRVLEQLIEEALVELAAEQRGLVVEERDIDRRLQALDQQLRQSGQASGVEAMLVDQGIAREEFRVLLRKSIAADWMMREDFGLQADDPLPEAKQSLWMKEMRLRFPVETPAAKTSASLAARVGDRTISRTQLAHKTLFALAAEERDKLLEDYVTIRLLLQRASADEVVIRRQEIDVELAERDRLLRAKLDQQGIAVEGITYLGMVEARGQDPARHLESERFRAEILQRLLAAREFGADGYRAFYESHQAEFDQKFGEKVRLATIFLQTQKRTPQAALDELTALRERLEQAEEPLAQHFGRLARIYSESPSRERGGDLGPQSWETLESLEIAAVLQSLQPGQLAGPVLTAQGAHLLLFTDHWQAASFEKILPQIEREARRQFVLKLRAQTVIERIW
jgi:parvulin-like peptidyl-prolyl isomerase